MKEIINSLLEWEKNEKGCPTQAQIHLTNFCNLKCFFCPTRTLLTKNEVDRKRELTVDEWLRIIDEGNALGVKEWHICGGGEPFFFADTAMEVVKKIKNSGRRGEVITNGTLFNKEAVRTMVKIGWDKVFFSLDSHIQKTHDELRGIECFKTIIKNVKSFAKIKKEIKSYLPTLCFHMVVCNKNYHQIQDMIKFAKKIGVQEVLLNALNVWKPEVAVLKLSEEQEKELVKTLDESLRLAKESGIGTNIEEFKISELFKKANVMDEALETKVKTARSAHGMLKVPCFYPWYNISIFADGVVQPCFIPQNEGEEIRGKDLKEIWFGECFEKIREKLKKGRLSKFCVRCNPWNFKKMSEIRNELQRSL